ncbi:hypothetical protein [Oceanibaculum pacificum]|nr:hypothetical protein [Oceanibaculum pacificum]
MRSIISSIFRSASSDACLSAADLAAVWSSCWFQESRNMAVTISASMGAG